MAPVRQAAVGDRARARRGAPSSEHANVAGSTVEWKLNVAVLEVDGLEGPLSTIVSATVFANEYVCTSNVRPSSSVGATVTVVPETVTLMKWKT